jgi:hypothetical protein
MRRVVSALSLVLLAGCATVSVVPGETTVETGITANQSALRDVSAAFCDRAVEKGWVEASGGLVSLAEDLIHGKDETAAVPVGYNARIGTLTQAPSLVLSRIAGDVTEARRGLLEVSREARLVLDLKDRKAANRTDVMNYERALVRAQLAHRNFSLALDEVSMRDDFDASAAPVDAALDAFADTIDSARETADGLADRYAGNDRAVS